MENTLTGHSMKHWNLLIALPMPQAVLCGKNTRTLNSKKSNPEKINAVLSAKIY
jgi:hypothetical protein